MLIVRILRWPLAAAGLVALILAGMIAVPVVRPFELAAVSDGVKVADRSNIPPLRFTQARDGTHLAYRHYPAQGPSRGAAILIHGSSGSSVAVHPLARVLADRGIESFAPDMRGHGASGTRGDISYLGQLDDDLADLVGRIRQDGVSAPLMLVGHSSGGGFALRISGSPLQNLFTHSVLLAPWLGTNSPSSRSNAGGWASPNLPRIVALSILRGAGIVCCDQLPVIAFAVPPHSSRILTSEYSMRLLTNFGANRNYRGDLATAKLPITLIGAADDELMHAGKYEEAVRGTSATVDVRILDNARHMDVVTSPPTLTRVADVIANLHGSRQ